MRKTDPRLSACARPGPHTYSTYGRVLCPPRPLASLSVDEVAELLGRLDLSKYADAFVAESVNGAHLAEVEEDDLKALAKLPR